MKDNRVDNDISKIIFNDRVNKESNRDSNHVILDIDGLELEETQNKVRNQLEGIVGVQSVDMSAGQNYVGVHYDDQTSSFEINNHLQNNGYKVTDIT